jgi:CRP/FNR family transcriptional regulator, cyclic AMP receptor protein
MQGAPVEAVRRVTLFAELNKRELEQVARLFKERRFAAGETVAMEGSGGAAFYLIDSGEAKVSVAGEERRVLTSGDSFGEIALIDEGARSATVTASSELVCYGLTYWDFRPLVEQNAAISWKLLQVVVKRLRDEQASRA